MLDRGQSNVVGAILLLSLVTVTVGGTGMIALSQWEDDIGYEPMTNIESEMTSVNLTLEHRTGEALYPENTTIRVVGVNDSVEMEDVLSPGGRQTIGFNRSTGSVKLYIIDDSTGTVLHSDTHTIRNPFVGLFFSVDGFTQPVYLLEGHSANYSVEKAYEFGSPDIFTRDARINIGDGSISSVDEGDTTITGVQTGETSLTVEADGSTGETQVIVLESDPALDVDSDVTTTGVKSADLDMDLLDLAGLPQVSLTAEYWPSHVFNERPNNNSDFVLADGGYYTPYGDEPSGYTHKDGYVHDNVPLDEGETRTYRFFDPGSGADYAWYLREGQQEDTDGLDDYTDYVRDYNNNVPDGAYRVEVTLSEDGDSIDVVLYDEASGGNIVREDRDLDVSDYDELYFSSYGYFGNDYNRHSLRLTGIDEYSNTETVQTASATSSEQVYTEEITEVEPNRDYVLTAYAESNVDSVGDSGDMVDFGLDGQTVETVSVTNLKNKKVQVTGELTDLGDLQQADLYIDYWQSHIFNANPTNNSDHVIADGKYYAPSDEPNGYIHNDQFVHDNAALEKGETRTYTYYNPGSGAKYSWYLRDGEQLEPDGGVDNSIDTSVRDYYTSVPNDKYRIEVTLSQNGKDLDVVLFDSATGGNIVREDRNIDVSGHKDLYFTTYGYFGDDYDRYSLRLIGIDTFSDQDRVRVEKDVTTEQTYTTDINVDVGRGYRYQAYSEELVGGYNVNSTGGVIAYRNGG